MITSAYYIAAVIAKVCNIFIVRLVSVDVLVFSGLILCNLSALVLVFLVEVHYIVIWICSIVLASGTSIIISVMLAWTDKYVGIKGHLGVLSSLCGNIGEIIYPGVTGIILERVSYMALMYITASCTMSCLILMLILQYLGMQYRKHVDALIGSERQPLIDKQEIVNTNKL